MTTPYEVDLNTSPEDLLLGLVNYDNGTTFSHDTLLMIKPPVPLVDDVRNTSVVLRTTDPIYDIKETTVFYNRIDLPTLFSIVGCIVREVDVWDETVIINSKVFAEIQRKYHILLRPSDFEVHVIDGISHLRAKDDNLAYIGMVPIVIESSLKTRVAIVQLSDFDTSMPPNDVRRFLDNKIVDLEPIDRTLRTPKANATILTYGLDWTGYETWIKPTSGKFANLANVKLRLSEFGITLSGNPNVYLKTTDQLANADNAYTHVVYTEYVDDVDMEGVLLFHYNV